VRAPLDEVRVDDGDRHDREADPANDSCGRRGDQEDRADDRRCREVGQRPVARRDEGQMLPPMRRSRDARSCFPGSIAILTAWKGLFDRDEWINVRRFRAAVNVAAFAVDRRSFRVTIRPFRATARNTLNCHQGGACRRRRATAMRERRPAERV